MIGSIRKGHCSYKTKQGDREVVVVWATRLELCAC